MDQSIELHFLGQFQKFLAHNLIYVKVCTWKYRHHRLWKAQSEMPQSAKQVLYRQFIILHLVLKSQVILLQWLTM